MRVVVDCNVIISAGLNPGICREVIFGGGQLSRDHFFNGYQYVRGSGREKFRGSRSNLTELIQRLMWNAVLVHPARSTISLPDKRDLMYLDAAISAQADVIITGDKRNFPEEEHRGVQILSTREFLALMHL